MGKPRLDRHDRIHHELFDENTSQVGSLGDIVEKHAGDALFLGPSDPGVGGADGGESDFVNEMNETDPAADEDMDPEDVLDAEAREEGYWATDQTGTVEGIARGFGTHLAQDLGRDGFQIEEIPSEAMRYSSRPAPTGELDDYDDEDDSDGKDDPGPALARASEPGANPASRRDPEPMPDRITTHDDRPRTTDEELDATRRIK
jgi:hypothetical protein